MAGEPGGQRLEGADAREARHLVTPVPALPQAVRPALSRSRTELTGLRRPSGSGRGRRCPTPASAPARGAWLAGCPPGLACTHNLGPGPGVQIGSSQMSLVRLKGRVASGWALSSGGLVSLRNRTHRHSQRADGLWGGLAALRGRGARFSALGTWGPAEPGGGGAGPPSRQRGTAAPAPGFRGSAHKLASQSGHTFTTLFTRLSTHSLRNRLTSWYRLNCVFSL